MTDGKLKTNFLLSGIFPEKTNSVILLGFDYTINPQNLIKIVRAIFEKFEIINFFLMWTTLNFRGRGKTKKNGSRYLHEDPRYRIWAISVNWFRLYVRRRSHRQTHTHTHIYTFFLKHFWGCGSDVESKFIKHRSRFFENLLILLSSDIRSEGSIAVIKKFDFNFFYDFWFYITSTV